MLEYFALLDESEGDLAADFEATYQRYMSRVVDSPHLYHLRHPGSYRRVNLGPRFTEYYIAFILWKEKVTVVAIAQAKRRPLY